MRRLILAAFGVFAVAGVASAQQPAPQPAVQYAPVPAPAAVAGTPVRPAAGATVIQGSGGCTSCGTGAGVAAKFKMSTGGDCGYGYPCQNGCGSLKSDLAFQFGSCKDFFNPCGPTCSGGPFSGLFGGKCGYLPFSKPFGTGWTCPRQYDSYSNH